LGKRTRNRVLIIPIRLYDYFGHVHNIWLNSYEFWINLGCMVFVFGFDVDLSIKVTILSKRPLIRILTKPLYPYRNFGNIATETIKFQNLMRNYGHFTKNWVARFFRLFMKLPLNSYLKICIISKY